MNDPFDFSDFDQGEAESAVAEHRAPAYLDGLNEPQREAVEATEGPLLVLAGAGTGKTRVLTTRLGHILATGKAHPGQLLAVTFTNKAAKEMSHRVAAVLGRPVEGMWLGTFHAICVRMLRRHAELVGLKSNFTILDTDDQIRLLKQLIAAEGIDDKRWPARMMAGLIDRWKNRALTPERIPEEESYAFANGMGGKLYRQYQERLKVLNACDFGDLLLHMITILQNNPDVLANYHRQFRYILVDEYQDTNVAQYLWLRLLAQASKNICCVGDDDQSIYGWRGAEVGNILRFEKDFPGARIIRLEQNYRSTGHILAAAGALISTNEGRLGKTLWTDAGEGEVITVRGVWDADEEARTIGDEVEALHTKGHSLDEIAILVRAGFQTREFEDRFITLGVPYRVIGGPRFYERMEIRDAMAYLRVIAQPDDDLAFERIVNKPKRGLGDTTMQKVHKAARTLGVSLTRAARNLVDIEELRPQARRALKTVLDDFDRWRAMLHDTRHTELTELVLEESGYVEMWQNDKSAEAPGRLENLTELVRAMHDFENLAGFLEHISLVMDNQGDNDGEKVSIMTLHAAKGLEFDTVFLPGWEEGVFPNQRALDEGGLKSLEEERRLAYVGLTRAKKKAHILFAGNRRIFGQWQSCIPSRFVDELPENHVEQMTESGLYGATQTNRWEDSWGFDNQDNANRHGPGWARARDRGFNVNPFDREQSLSARRQSAKKKQVTLDMRPDAVLVKETGNTDFAIGEKVFHEKFGYGIIEDTDGNKLTVVFEHSGSKRILDSFVRKA